MPPRRSGNSRAPKMRARGTKRERADVRRRGHGTGAASAELQSSPAPRDGDGALARKGRDDGSRLCPVPFPAQGDGDKPRRGRSVLSTRQAPAEGSIRRSPRTRADGGARAECIKDYGAEFSPVQRPSRSRYN
ncbi:hypothetical protein B0H17DRAFT_1050866 [Mycena rosella]|uniref:Uncharacterized protein n=1 Tax=Mycena rosella TaxID=1033263 RepID=A0AAD7GPR7_MYCRO|nr:hypothetical protein B0H17DRAFT_1050866 [Mycena rosella]